MGRGAADERCPWIGPGEVPVQRSFGFNRERDQQAEWPSSDPVLRTASRCADVMLRRHGVLYHRREADDRLDPVRAAALVVGAVGLLMLGVGIWNERMMQRHRQPGVTYNDVTFRRD